MPQSGCISTGATSLIGGILLLLAGCGTQQSAAGPEAPAEVSSGRNVTVISGENSGNVMNVNGNSLNVTQDRDSLLITGNADSLGSIDANGIHYEVQGGNRLEMKNGRLLVNGKDFGTVQKGDSVSLDAAGRLSVNNQKREESAP